MAKRVNAKSPYVFQVDVKVRNNRGEMVTPKIGEITDVKLRLSDSEDGEAISANVDDLVAVETAKAGRFAYKATPLLLTNYVLVPLGDRAPFFAVWYRTVDGVIDELDEMDMEAFVFTIVKGNYK